MGAGHLQRHGIRVLGSAVISDGGTTLAAGNNISIEAAQNTSSSTSFYEKKESGMLDGDGIGITIGTREQSTDQKNRGTTAAASTVGSIAGNVTLQAGEAYRQVGSDVMAPGGDVTIVAKKVDIVEARETTNSETEQKFKQTGLSVGLSNPIASAVQTAQGMAQAASNTGDGRMQALAGAAAALNGYNTYKSLTDAAGNFSVDKATDVSVNISLGTSKSQSNSASQSDTARGSTVAAGNNVSIVATGAGQDSNLLVQGSTLTAGNNVTLLADNKVNLLAARNDASSTSSNSSSSSSVGVSYGVASGFGVSVSASKGQGNSNGADTGYTNTQVNAGNTASIVSGGDTNLISAVVAANTVKADVGGNLNVQSLQDTSTYTSRQSSSGGSISVGTGGVTGGGVSAGKSNIDSNYASVVQQSGIRAGDGGFQVNVAGNTDLKGAVIASTQAAVALNRNTFTTGSLSFSDIRNSAEYKGSGYGVSASMGKGLDADKKTIYLPGGGFGVGSAEGNASSTSSSGISGIAGNTAVRTGDAETGIQKIFDAQKVQRDIDAQIAITAEFGKSASKAWGDYANRQQAGAPDAAAAACWAESGLCRAAGHILIGGLGGGVGGAAGAGAAAFAADAVNQATQDLPPVLKNLVGAGIAASIGSAVGGLAGAAAAFNEDTNNRQLNPNQISRIQQLANGSNAAVVRLTIAACAIRRCADGVPPTDVNYRLLMDMQTAGATDEYAAERSTLAQQTYRVGTNPSGQTSPLKLFNDYNTSDSMVDAFTSSNGGIRTMGLLQALGGAGMITAGVGACTTTFGCYLGGAGATMGWDQVVTGSNTAATGQPTLTMGEKVLQGLSLSPQAAALTYAVLGLAPAAGQSFLISRVVNAEAAANAWARGTYNGTASVSYDGAVYRYQLPERSSTTWEISKYNIGSEHRYSEVGIGAVYGGTKPATSAAEVRSYGSLDGLTLYSREIVVNNVLDLTNPAARQALGISLSDITQVAHGGSAYNIPQSISAWARQQGYNAILAPSAQTSTGANLISFKALEPARLAGTK